MADVYAAELAAAAGFRKRVAIKRMRPHLVANEDFLSMFLEEARLGSQLSHPKICEVYELAQADGEFYIAMEYLHGVTLSHLLTTCAERGLTMPVSLAVNIFAQACEGLHYAHERKDSSGASLSVIHRDVSPENLFLRTDGVVKVLDFGIAKTDDSSHQTSTGSVKGKDAYMSPEQLEARRLDRRTDIWSLGVVLFETLAGRRLFRRGSLLETVYAIANEPVPNLLDLRPDLPPALCEVVSRALCRDRDGRFASAEVFRRALLDAAESEGVAPQEAIGELVRSVCAATLAERERLFEDNPAKSGERELSHRVALPKSGANRVETPLKPVRAVPEARADEPKASPTLPDWDLAELPPMPSVFQRSAASVGHAENGQAQAGDDVQASAAESVETHPAEKVETPTADNVQASTSEKVDTRPDDIVPASAAEKVETPTADNVDTQTGFQRLATKHSMIAAVILAVASVGIASVLPAQIPSSPVPQARALQEGSTGLAEPPAPSPTPSALSDRSAAKDTRAPAAPRARVAERAEARHAANDRRDTGTRAARPRGAAVEKHTPSATPRAAPHHPAAVVPGKLFVGSNPAATIYLDDKKLGVTPLQDVEVPPGFHALRAVSADGRVKTLRIHVESRRAVRRRIQW
jgi:serine/threonine-protein kinase